MAKSKWIKTTYPGVYKYETKKGVKYGIRVRYTDDNEKWKEKSESGFDNIKAARKRKTELESKINKDLASTFSGDKTTLAQWYETYCTLMQPTWKDTTQLNVLAIYKCLAPLHNTPLSKITLAHYQKYINTQLQEMAIASVKSIHKRMMAIINAAVKYGILDRNHLTAVIIHKPEQIKKEKHIGVNELYRLDEAAEREFNELQHGMYVLMRIGWRRGEVLGLIKQGINIIDDDAVEVSVLETKTLGAETTTPKTSESYRTNTLTGEFARIIIKAYNVAQDKYESENTPFESSSRIFINKELKTHHATYPNQILAVLGRMTNIKVNPHKLRHTFASQAIASGVSPVEVAKWLGHSKIDMTLNTYSHSTEEARNKLIGFVNCKQSSHKSSHETQGAI